MKLALAFLFSVGVSESFASITSHRELKRRGFSFGGFRGGSGDGDGSATLSCTDPQVLMLRNMQNAAYNYGGEMPSKMSCGTYNGASCVSEYKGKDTAEFPCTQCDLKYPDAKFCQDYPCYIFDCKEPDTAADVSRERSINKTATNPSRSTTDLISVNVCAEFTWSEFFTIVNTYTQCRLKFVQRMLTRHFTSGVSNVRKVSVLMKRSTDEKGMPLDAFESCEVLVDDKKCKSCKMCAFNETGLFEADCESIAPGAIVTCNDINSFGILERSLSGLILQEGNEYPAELIKPDFAESWVGWKASAGHKAEVCATLVVSSLLILTSLNGRID